MSRLIADLESVLQQLIVEHRKLLKHVEAHQLAMKTMALDAMDQSGNQQNASRLRITALETHRRAVILQITQQHKLSGEVTITRLAQLFPQRSEALQKLRDELKKTILHVQSRTRIAGRLAGSVLGHLNTVVRLIAGAVEGAGIYTKSGVPQVSNRIGVMEAVG